MVGIISAQHDSSCFQAEDEGRQWRVVLIIAWMGSNQDIH
jgi:hypothetical protein